MGWACGSRMPLRAGVLFLLGRIIPLFFHFWLVVYQEQLQQSLGFSPKVSTQAVGTESKKIALQALLGSLL